MGKYVATTTTILTIISMSFLIASTQYYWYTKQLASIQKVEFSLFNIHGSNSVPSSFFLAPPIINGILDFMNYINGKASYNTVIEKVCAPGINIFTRSLCDILNRTRVLSIAVIAYIAIHCLMSTLSIYLLYKYFWKSKRDTKNIIIPLVINVVLSIGGLVLCLLYKNNLKKLDEFTDTISTKSYEISWGFIFFISGVSINFLLFFLYWHLKKKNHGGVKLPLPYQSNINNRLIPLKKKDGITKIFQ